MDFRLEFLAYIGRRGDELRSQIKPGEPNEEVILRAEELLLLVNFLDSKEKLEAAMKKMREPA